ncbi:hypothetical protein OSB04_016232 [Centaurea solstitialis]|uniref:Uncharacterized protein n=1 Tax=Centaurea solstitialis TaxID=347529 RepID=A0AA38W899_9ASTR|nr:hypothetical protein OSB04_016232 [Centaurea solstitialis]
MTRLVNQYLIEYDPIVLMQTTTKTLITVYNKKLKSKLKFPTQLYLIFLLFTADNFSVDDTMPAILFLSTQIGSTRNRIHLKSREKSEEIRSFMEELVGMKRFDDLLCAEDSNYVKKKYGGYFGVFVAMLAEEGEIWDIRKSKH